ncbi:FAD-binding oxidoreductase [Chitinasiproducens palmae]|uniref:FAD-binding oxidoreductase n=1 Tax=Chitinasiproducens palmae TaxID=1770053 RepID=UPI000B804528|nr:FAD-binding oxidoreductase [Chitinasiproducens palmae]
METPAQAERGAALGAFLADCRAALGDTHVLTAASAQAPFLTDWRKRYTGRACAVLRPASTAEVAAVVAAANKHDIALVTQGGNTGHAGGATPDASGAQAVLSTNRLRRIRALDAANDTITVEAGCALADVQAAARAAGRLFPLSLASEGSCTIGGNLATNAGGTAVLRHGNARALCLGLEVVTADAQVWDGLRALRKDNTGYDLRDLFIGAEGTLGVITAAVLKLQPMPAASVTAVATVDTCDDALRLLALARARADALLTGFELMSWYCVELIDSHFPTLRMPLARPGGATANGFAVLLELSDHESEAHGRALLERLLADASNEGVVRDAVVAQSLAQSQTFWAMREHIPLAQARDGLNVKHDIALPISAIGEFISSTDRAIAARWPGARMVTFGHLGDGNLHYNVQAPVGQDPADFLRAAQAPMNRLVYDQVHARGGSISAEHGIGQLKVDDLARYKSPVELALMTAVKRALDPHNRFNPGKVIAAPPVP